jgi:hypothetical protein
MEPSVRLVSLPIHLRRCIYLFGRELIPRVEDFFKISIHILNRAIAGAMAAGELTPDEAGAVAGVIEAKRRAIETVEHEERLRKLEERNPGESAY